MRWLFLKDGKDEVRAGWGGCQCLLYTKGQKMSPAGLYTTHTHYSCILGIHTFISNRYDQHIATMCVRAVRSRCCNTIYKYNLCSSKCGLHAWCAAGLWASGMPRRASMHTNQQLENNNWPPAMNKIKENRFDKILFG